MENMVSFMSTMNRIGNAGNRYQGDFKRVLCVCSAGLLRSPTAALVLSQDPFNFNTRAVGVSQEYALVPLETVHLHWADEIVTMEAAHSLMVEALLEKTSKPTKPRVVQLDIPDEFAYRDPRLVDLIKQNYELKTRGQ